MQTNPFMIEKIREKDMETILDWFNMKKDILYKIAATYINSPKVIEDIFYKVIMKVYDENRRLKKNSKFDVWVISNFLKECREVSKNKVQIENINVSENDILNKLSLLESNYKDSISLSYFMSLPYNEVAHILQVPIQTVKSNLLTGIQLLSKELVNKNQNLNCKEFQNQFFDYLNWTLDRKRKIELEIHIHTCQSCQTVLATVQNVILTLREADDLWIPVTFMDQVTTKVNEIQKKRKLIKKKRTIKSIVAASILSVAISIAYFTNGIGYLYYSWLDYRELEDEEMLAFLKSGVGEPLNLEDESNGIKVKIKTAIADDYQTLIYFEVEDTNDDGNKYTINLYDGMIIENERDVINQQAFPLSSFPIDELRLDKKDEKVFSGKISLLPISTDSGTIQLKFSKLLKVKENLSNPEDTMFRTYNEMENITGEWSFEIPITKHASVENKLNKEIVIEGIPIILEKFVFAPTTTVLQYSFDRIQQDKQINSITIESLKSGTKTSQTYSNGYYYHDNGSINSTFESLYFDKPKVIEVQFSSIFSYIEDDVTFALNKRAKEPQTFEYLGNTISIENITERNVKKVSFIDAPPETREYESLHFQFKSDKDEPLFMSFINSDGVLVDRDQNTYDPENYNYFKGSREHPRYYQTKIDLELFKEASSERVFPDKLQIYGYSTTKYIDEVVDIRLD